ncbi:MAG: Hsp20/alpha crystallin family protein [Chloroflexi bacterium]|nr:Hsp20/alpha crystallin family protein [Chloroflexota bacterium]MBP8057061.1 Hsp20/alpha crystallin family protein [Chloroflexota bacterium]
MNAVIRRNPVREMMTLRGALDRMFDDSFFAPFRQDELVDWGLPLDVLEKDDNFIVKASVPGINPNELDITLENDVLTIKGESHSEKEETNERYHLRERRVGRFGRTVTFPIRVNGEAITADYKDGVLTLTVPKAEEVKPRRININVQNGK